jgi:hypothetical protein
MKKIACLGLLAAMACPRSAARTAAGVENMDPRTEIARKLLALPEESWFRGDGEVDNSVVERLSQEDSFSGIAAGAPEAVDLSRRSELPFILLSRTTRLRNWEVNIAPNTTLIAVDLADGTVRRGHAFQSNKQRDTAELERSMTGPRPTPLQARGNSNVGYRFDARRLLGLPWVPSRQALTVIVYDWTSNTVTVRLERPGAEVAEPAPIPFDRAWQLVAGHPRRAKLPSFIRSPQSPKVDGEGVRVSVPEQAVAGAPLVVQGTARVKVLPGSVVSPPPRAELDPVPWEPGAGVEVPRAMLRVMLLLVSKDVIDPPRIDVEVPVFGKDAVRPGDVVDAYFGIDLNQHLQDPVPPGEYLVYAVCGEHLAGPQRMVVAGIAESAPR